MGVTTWTNGISTSTGPAYVGYKPTWTSGTVLWLDSVTGNDSNDGFLEELPKATLASAITDAGTNTADTIVVKSGHVESIGASQVFTGKAGLTIIGLGTGNNRPRFTCTGAAIDMFAVSVTDVWIENLYFAASTAAADSRIVVTNTGFTLKDCYFQCGSSDSQNTVLLGPTCHNARIEGCYFISTGTTALQPGSAFGLDSTGRGVVVKDCTFDGGSAGWSSPALSVSDSAVYFRFLNNTFTGYSDCELSSSGAKGTAAGVTQSGVGSFSWTP